MNHLDTPETPAQAETPALTPTHLSRAEVAALHARLARAENALVLARVERDLARRDLAAARAALALALDAPLYLDCAACAEHSAHLDRLTEQLARADEARARDRVEIERLHAAVQHLRTQTGGAR